MKQQKECVKALKPSLMSISELVEVILFLMVLLQNRYLLYDYYFIGGIDSNLGNLKLWVNVKVSF